MPKKLYQKLIANFIFFFFIGIIGIYIIGLVDKKRKSFALEVQSQLIESRYKTNYQNFNAVTDEINIMFQNNKKLINFLCEANEADEESATKLRIEIYKLLIKNYKNLNNLGISQINFYLKNNKNFVNMNKPEECPTDVLRLAKDVIRTNPFNAIQEGFKISKLTNGLTFTYPLFDIYNQYIAGVEITFSTKKIINNILDKFSYDAHVLISKDLITNIIANDELRSNYEYSWESSKYMLEKSTHKRQIITNLYHTVKNKKLQNEIEKKIQTKEMFSVYVHQEYTNLIMTFLPLHDSIGSKNNVYLVIYSKSNYLQELIRENKYLLILFFSFLLMLFLFISYILKNEEKFEKLALFDHLTKLPNRTLFLIELDKEIQRAKRYQTKIALLFVDLDGFKAVNDTFGHQIGDDLLQYCAKSFAKDIRKSDTVARIGGDEFVIILSDIKGSDESISIANKIITNISKRIEIKKNEIHIGASIGISIYPDHALDETTLIKIADNMMYESKNSGKNRVTIKDTLVKD